jgi:hypothetical protein
MVAYYGGFGMPTVVVVAGASHKILFNSNNEDIDTVAIAKTIQKYFLSSDVDQAPDISDGLHFTLDPANETVSCSFKNPGNDALHFALYNLQGECVSTQTVSSAVASSIVRIPVSHCASGCYILRVSTQNRSVSRMINLIH